MVNYVIAVTCAVVFIAVMIFAIWYACTHEPRIVKNPLAGKSTVRIEAAIRAQFSKAAFAADDAVQALRSFNPDDIWATLVDLLSNEQLIEIESRPDYFEYRFASN